MIRIKKRSQTEWLLLVLIIMPLLFALLIEFFGIPRIIKYTLDMVWAVILVYIIKFYPSLKVTDSNDIKIILCWVLLFFFYIGLTYCVQYQSVLYWLWGLRNNFRFYVAFFAFIYFMRCSLVKDVFRAMNAFFWVNAVVSLWQFYVLNVNGDYLGGIFGTEQGVNGYTTIFFSIVLSYSFICCIEKKESLLLCALKCVVVFIISAMCEIKFFYFVSAMIVGLVFLFTKFSWRKLLLLIGGGLCILAGGMLLIKMFPNSSGLLSIAGALQEITSDKGYTSAGDINRLTAIPVINNLWLTTLPTQIFGLGLGNCDTATYAFLNTPFFVENGYMHYTWLSYAHMYLECGWLGLLFYFGFFGFVYFKAIKIQKRVSADGVTYCRLARIMAIVCMVISIYNSSLRTEAGYMAYFVMSIPFVYDRHARQKKWLETNERIAYECC